MTSEVIFDNISGDFATATNTPIPLISDGRTADDKVRSRVFTRNITSSGQPVSYGTTVANDITTADFDSFPSLLLAHPTFGSGIAGWTNNGGGATVTHDAVKRRLVIGTTMSAFGGLASPRPEYGAPVYTTDAHRFIKIKWHCTAITGPAAVDIQVPLTGAPYWRTVATFTAIGEGTAMYPCQGDEGGGLLVKGMGGAEGTIEFAYFAATIY